MGEGAGRHAFHKQLAAAFDEKIAADTRRLRSHRALLDFLGLLVVTPILALACAVTLGLTYPPGELALNHCEEVTGEALNESVEPLQWTPGYRCVMEESSSQIADLLGA